MSISAALLPEFDHEMATTRKTLARFAARPPQKSPPPHEAAATRLRPDAPTLAKFIAAYHTRRIADFPPFQPGLPGLSTLRHILSRDNIGP